MTRTTAGPEQQSQSPPMDQLDGAQAGLPQTDDEPAGQTTEVLSHLKQILAAVSETHATMQRQKARDELIASLNEERRQCAEDFYEKEVLTPVFLALIGIADRCREDIRRRRREMTSTTDLPVGASARALQMIIAARRADAVEIENLLATLGVEAFSHHGARFKASHQTAIKRIPTDAPSQHLRVADKHRPGYRRGERVIRPEWVSVYTCNTGE